ncbi:hypothetical protein [Cohnella thailandensis]|uniref:Uncharacterized protein n=1 Tax=Cohnella thailandensis TaxID=557557 RepID=A0A841SVM6_9BACL|nr:hypothetical protein [Cohnella thailandensis]MBB6635029.1 hypothetical protein [Cohnella thailandensis]MBP1975747.1 hypothetical protein [Cohnella thailandensis]
MRKFSPIIVLEKEEKRIRFQSGNAHFVRKWVSFSSVELAIGNNQAATLDAIKQDTQGNGRYWYVRASDLEKLVSPAELVLYTEEYEIKITENKYGSWYALFREGLLLTPKEYDSNSVNPYGRFDNEIDGMMRIIEVSPSNLTGYKKFFKSSGVAELLHHPYELVSEAPSLSNWKRVSVASNYSVYVPAKTNLEMPFPSTSTVSGVHEAFFEKKDMGIQYVQPKKTRTLSTVLTASDIQAWSGQARYPQQATVMNSNPASKVAKALALPPDLDYDWLHLIAFSFGPAENLDTQQHPNNLVLGTKAANTKMLETESKIKKLASKSYAVMVTVTVTCTEIKGGQYASWLAKEIKYSYRTLDIEDSNTIAEEITFNPFLRVTPSLCEYMATMYHLDNISEGKKPRTKQSKANLSKFKLTGKRPLPSDDELFAFADNSLWADLKLEDVSAQKTDSLGDSMLFEMAPSNPRLRRRISQSLEEIPGHLYTAEASVFGQSDIPVTGAVLDSGEHFALLNLAKDGFTFASLFQDFHCDHTDLFMLDDVNVHFGLAGEEGDSTLSFSGVLRLESGPLAWIKSLLNLNNGLLISGEIRFDGFSDAGLIRPTSFTLTSAASMFLPLPGGMTLTSGSLQISVGPSANNLTLTQGWHISAIIAGTVEIPALGGDKPAVLNASLGYQGNNLFMTAEVEGIVDVFGIPGFTLDSLAIQGSVGADNRLQVAATMIGGTQVYGFFGEISKEYAGIAASAEHFTIKDVAELYCMLSGEELAPPEHEVAFDNVFVGLATRDCTIAGRPMSKGLTLRGDLTVEGHRFGIEAVISSDGVSFNGSIDRLQIGPLEIKEAKLSLELYRASSGKPTKLAIYGAVVIEGIEVDCEVRFEKRPEGSNVLVYASIAADNLKLSTIIPAVEDSFADSLAFEKAVFIYSSSDGLFHSTHCSYPVRQGVQLIGKLKEIPALSSLSRSRQSGLLLSAHFGSQTDITIDMSGIKLELGSGVDTDSLYARVVLLPKPALQLALGLNVAVANQAGPLHFDLVLEIDALGARGSATMKNWWVEPFGIEGLKIGPAIALQLGIIYAQFAATGTPSEFGIAGGLAVGSVEAQMAVNISEDPTREILMGSLTRLTSRDLVQFAEQLTGLSLLGEDSPNFFEFEDLLLYIAPAGGSIGTITFEPGFSFSGKMVLFGKRASIYTRASKTGVAVKGSLEHLELGPLEIRGHQGPDATIDLVIDEKKQSLFVDGALSIFGMNAEVFADISNRGAHFHFELAFGDVMKFVVRGDSEGEMSKPETLDFSLYALWQNDLTAYLQTTVARKLHDAIHAVEHDIDEAKERVNEAERAYLELFTPARDRLNEAEKEANRYLRQLTLKVEEERRKFDSSLNDAKKEVEACKAAFDGALLEAESLVAQAQAEYDAAIAQAEAAVEQAQAEYDQVLYSAEQIVDDAQRIYEEAMDSAIRDVRNVRSQISSIQQDIDAASYELSHLEWYEVPYMAPILSAKIVSLEVAMLTAQSLLDAAEGALTLVKYGQSYLVLGAAKRALETVRVGVQYTALRNSKQALALIQFGGQYMVLDNAKRALAAVRLGTDYQAWTLALKSLELVHMAGQTALSAAESALADYGQSAAHLAVEIAKQALEAIQTGTSALAFENAKVLLEAAKYGAATTLKLAEFAAEHAGDLLDVRKVELSGSLKEAKQGKLLSVSIEAAVFGQEFRLDIDFDVREPARLIEDLFRHALNQATSFITG